MNQDHDKNLGRNLTSAQQELERFSATIGKTLEEMEFFRAVFEYANDVIVYLSLDGTIVGINSRIDDLLGYSREECLGANIQDVSFFNVLSAPDITRCLSLCEQTLTEGQCVTEEVEARHKNGKKVFFEGNTRAVKKDGKIIGSLSILRDISKRKEDERALRRYQEELERMVEERTANLEETNTALKVLLRNIENDKSEIKERIHFNIKELVMPYIDQLKIMSKNDRCKTCLNIVETNLTTITASYVHHLSMVLNSLTPTELKVSNLIIQGRSSKEIAEVIGTTERTVETHRRNIRKKLGVTSQKTNLRSCLLSANSTGQETSQSGS